MKCSDLTEKETCNNSNKNVGSGGHEQCQASASSKALCESHMTAIGTAACAFQSVEFCLFASNPLRGLPRPPPRHGSTPPQEKYSANLPTVDGTRKSRASRSTSLQGWLACLFVFSFHVCLSLSLSPSLLHFTSFADWCLLRHCSGTLCVCFCMVQNQ